MYQGASEIKKLDGPGGGYIVTIPDPWGVPFHVIWGQQLVESLVPKDPTKPTNIGIANVNIKARPAGDFQRFDNSSIVPIHKLGHVVLEVPSYLESVIESVNSQWLSQLSTALLECEEPKNFMSNSLT